MTHAAESRRVLPLIRFMLRLRLEGVEHFIREARVEPSRRNLSAAAFHARTLAAYAEREAVALRSHTERGSRESRMD